MRGRNIHVKSPCYIVILFHPQITRNPPKIFACALVLCCPRQTFEHAHIQQKTCVRISSVHNLINGDRDP